MVEVDFLLFEGGNLWSLRGIATVAGDVAGFILIFARVGTAAYRVALAIEGGAIVFVAADTIRSGQLTIARAGELLFRLAIFARGLYALRRINPQAGPLAVHRRGAFYFAGKVGTGFSDAL